GGSRSGRFPTASRRSTAAVRCARRSSLPPARPSGSASAWATWSSTRSSAPRGSSAQARAGAQPGGELLLARLAGGEGEHGGGRFVRWCVDTPAIHLDEQHGRDEGRALVAVCERMVAGDAEGVGGGQGDQVGAAFVGEAVLRPAERALEHAL